MSEDTNTPRETAPSTSSTASTLQSTPSTPPPSSSFIPPPSPPVDDPVFEAKVRERMREELKKVDVNYVPTPEEKAFIHKMINTLFWQGVGGFAAGFGISSAFLWYVKRRSPTRQAPALAKVGLTVGGGLLVSLCILSWSFGQQFDQLITLKKSPIASRAKTHLSSAPYNWNPQDDDPNTTVVKTKIS